MKKRGRICGETGGHHRIDWFRAAVGDDIHIHLMGHSFGCIVVASIAILASPAALEIIFDVFEGLVAFGR